MAPSRHSSKLLNPFTCRGYCPNCSMVERILPAFTKIWNFSKTSSQHILLNNEMIFPLTLMNSLSYECPIEKLNHWVVLFVFWTTGESESPKISAVISNSMIKISQAPFSISKSVPAISCQLEGILEPVEQLMCELTNILKQARMLPLSHSLHLTTSVHTSTICCTHTAQKGDKLKEKPTWRCILPKVISPIDDCDGKHYVTCHSEITLPMPNNGSKINKCLPVITEPLFFPLICHLFIMDVTRCIILSPRHKIWPRTTYILCGLGFETEPLLRRHVPRTIYTLLISTLGY